MSLCQQSYSQWQSVSEQHILKYLMHLSLNIKEIIKNRIVDVFKNWLIALKFELVYNLGYFPFLYSETQTAI